MNQILAKNIRRYRDLRGFTQPQLAELSGISFRMIQSLEYETSSASLATISALSKTLKVSPGKLLEDVSENIEFASENSLKELIRLLSTLDDSQTKRVLTFTKALSSGDAGTAPGAQPHMPKTQNKGKRVAD